MTNTENLRIEILQEAFKKHPHILKQLLKSEDLHEFPLYKLRLLPVLYKNYKDHAKYLKLAIHEYKSILAFYNSLLLINNRNDEIYDFYNLETELKIEFLNDHRIKYELCNESGYLFIYIDSYHALELLAKKLWCISRQFSFYKKYKLDDENTQFVIFCKVDNVESFNGLTIYKNKNYIVYNKKDEPLRELPTSIINKFQLKIKNDKITLVDIITMFVFAFFMNIPLLNIFSGFLLVSIPCIIMSEPNIPLKTKLKQITLVSVIPLLLSTILLQPHYFNTVFHKNALFEIEEPFYFQVNNPWSFIKPELPDTFVTELHDLENKESGIMFLENQKKSYQLVLNPEPFKKLYESQDYDYIAFFIKEKALTSDTISVASDTIIEQEDVRLLELFNKNDDYANSDIHKQLYYKIMKSGKHLEDTEFIKKFVNGYVQKLD